MKKVILISLIVFFSINESFPRSQKDQILIYNICLGGITGGVGSVINKKKDQNWYQTFLKGFIQGSAGGFIRYQGKRIVYQINKKKKLQYGWFAKIVHSTGSSFVENAAANRNFWESWSMHFGFLRFESEPLQMSFRVKLLPFATYNFVRACFIGKFDIEKSLKLGTLYFSTDTLIDNRLLGKSLWSNMIIYERYYKKHKTIAHEYIHVFQFRDYLALNNNFLISDRKLKNKKLYKKLSNYIYFDTPFFLVPYGLEGKYNDKWYYKNFFEMEAEYFGTLRKVPIPR